MTIYHLFARYAIILIIYPPHILDICEIFACKKSKFEEVVGIVMKIVPFARRTIFFYVYAKYLRITILKVIVTAT